MSEQPYRAPIPIEPDPYLAAWADLRRRRVLGWTAFVLCGLLFLLLSGIWLDITAAMGGSIRDPGPYIRPQQLLREEATAAAQIMWLPLVIWGAATLNRWHFRCPHCASRMVRSRRCGRCGITVATPKSAVDASVTGVGA